MIETIDNIIQILVLGVCLAVSIQKSVSTNTREWTLSAIFYAVFFLGDLYWSLVLVFYNKTPSYFFVSEIAWYSSYLILDLIMVQLRTEDEKKYKNQILWGIPVFTGLMAVFYMTYGDYVINIIAAVLMSMLLWHSLGGLMYLKKNPGSGNRPERKMMLIAVAVLCLIEYCMWTVSCFWSVPGIPLAYSILDMLLTVVFALLLAAIGKAISGKAVDI